MGLPNADFELCALIPASLQAQPQVCPAEGLVRRTRRLREDWSGTPLAKDRGYVDPPDESITEGIELHRRPESPAEEF